MGFKVGDEVRVKWSLKGHKGKVSVIDKVYRDLYYLGSLNEWFYDYELELIEEAKQEKGKHKFKVGDKVVCVDNGGLEKNIDVGEEYTVTGIVGEYINVDGMLGFYPHRFRLAEEEKQEKSINELKYRIKEKQGKSVGEIAYQISLDTKNLTTKLDIIAKHLKALSEELKENEK